jgi:hypothetical protein
LPVTVKVTGITVVSFVGSLDERVRFRLYVPAFKPEALKVITAKEEFVALTLPFVLVIENHVCAEFAKLYVRVPPDKFFITKVSLTAPPHKTDLLIEFLFNCMDGGCCTLTVCVIVLLEKQLPTIRVTIFDPEVE